MGRRRTGSRKNRVEKLLEDACIKLSVVASDIFGISGREMMAALIAGEQDPKVLAQLARSRMRPKIGQLEKTFNGHFDNHHRFLLTRMLGRIDAIDADIAAVDEQIEAHLVPFGSAAARLDDIPGICRVAAAIIIAEVGWTCRGSRPPGTCVPGRNSLPASASPPVSPRATDPPGTATVTSPGPRRGRRGGR